MRQVTWAIGRSLVSGCSLMVWSDVRHAEQGRRDRNPRPAPVGWLNPRLGCGHILFRCVADDGVEGQITMTLRTIIEFLQSYGGPVVLMLVAWIGTSVYYGTRKGDARLSPKGQPKARGKEASVHD